MHRFGLEIFRKHEYLKIHSREACAVSVMASTTRRPPSPAHRARRAVLLSLLRMPAMSQEIGGSRIFQDSRYPSDSAHSGQGPGTVERYTPQSDGRRISALYPGARRARGPKDRCPLP